MDVARLLRRAIARGLPDTCRVDVGGSSCGPAWYRVEVSGGPWRFSCEVRSRAWRSSNIADCARTVVGALRPWATR